MPVSPAYAEGLSEPLVAMYAEAERVLLERIGRSMATGLDAPTWAEQKLLEVQLVQAGYARDLERLHRSMLRRLFDAIRAAWNRGQGSAEVDLGQRQARQTADALQPALAALIRDTTDRLVAVEQRTLRAIPDVYRDVTRKAAAQTLIGSQTRREAAQDALDRLADRGITGFVDVSGRRWDATSYVEMSVRTATGRAAVEGHTTRLQAAGQDLIRVSDAPQECSVCRRFEGKVLSLSGTGYPSLDNARAAGFMHPGCRHSISIYLPGITQLPERTADPDGDRARQHLRYLERQVRASRRREAVALDDTAKAAARRRAAAYQAKIREHVATTSAKRQGHRERLGVPR